MEGGAARGRYSMIGLDPDVIFRVRDGKAEINRAARHDREDFAPCEGKPLDALRALLDESAIPAAAPGVSGMPPMAAGVFGYLGYDMVREMERLAPAKPDPIGTPDALLVRPTLMAVFNSVRDEIWLVTPGPAAGRQSPPRRPTRPRSTGSTKRSRRWKARCATRASATTRCCSRPTSRSPTPARRAICAMVEAAKSYIRAGDIFQVVLSQRFTSPFQLPAFSLYRALRRVNPAPFLCYLDFADFQIVCSSPEILVRARDGKVTIRPIAGTRWRGATREEDEALERELLADEKERAEHLMLLDLGRNDVGRVAEIGTVSVTEQFVIERYSHVMHIVSNVEGKLDPNHDLIDALSAGFPAGTVSGAPKVRAMEIIDELEVDKRGIYGGCIGYFGASGEMDTCIVLRTSVVKDGKMHVQAGAGIVYDSDPASEQRECVNKSRALFRAAEEALRFASSARRGSKAPPLTPTIDRKRIDL